MFYKAYKSKIICELGQNIVYVSLVFLFYAGKYSIRSEFQGFS